MENPQINNTKTNNPWPAYYVLLGGIFLMLIVLGMNTPAYPFISAELGIDAAYIAWMSAAYSMSAAVLAPMMGSLGDKIGLKKVMILGLLLFTLGCGFVWLAPNYALILVGRFTQGLGMAATMPAVMAYAGRFFAGEKLAKAYTVFGAVCSGGVIFGPLLAGYLVDNYSWRAIYLFGAVSIGIATLATLFIMPQVEIIKKTIAKFDFTGSVTLFIAIGSLLILPTLASQIGWKSIPAYILMALFIIFIVLFLNIEKKVVNPLININLITTKQFAIPAILYLISNGFVTCIMYMGSYYIAGGLRLSAQITGIWTTVIFVVMTAFAVIVGKLMTSMKYKTIAFLSAILWIAAFALFAFVKGSITTLYIGAVLIGAAGSFGTPLYTFSSLDGVLASDRGSASGTFRLIGDLGAPIFVATFVPLLSVIGRTEQGPNFVASFPKVAMIMLVPAVLAVFITFVYPQYNPKKNTVKENN